MCPETPPRSDSIQNIAHCQVLCTFYYHTGSKSLRCSLFVHPLGGMSICHLGGDKRLRVYEEEILNLEMLSLGPGKFPCREHDACTRLRAALCT